MRNSLIALTIIIWIVLTACSPVESQPTVRAGTNVPTVQQTETQVPTIDPTAELTRVVVTALPSTLVTVSATKDATIAPTDVSTSAPTDVPSKTATSPPPTITPTEFPTVAPTWTPTPEPLNTPRPIPTETTIDLLEEGKTRCVIGVIPHDLLNIRDSAGVDGEIIGTIPAVGQQINYLGETQMVEDARWIKIDYYGRAGWVNGLFLARQEGMVEDAVADTALQVLNTLRDGDMVALSPWVHPEKGITFAPETYISDIAPNFSADATAQLWDDTMTYLWGRRAGSGEEILLDYRAFYEEFLFSADFLFADAVGYDTNIMEGGAIDNSRDIFPDSQFVEYHFDGFDPDFGGLDFRTLRIVLELFDGRYYAVAVVNNEWSP